METLSYLATKEMEHERPKSSGLIFQLTGGGAAATFYRGMPADEVISKLRQLAEILEHGVIERQKQKVKP